MLLSPQTDLTAHGMVLNAYRRAIHAFDRYDATVAIDT